MADSTSRLFHKVDLGPFWTMPNALSLLRLVLAVPVAYLILVDGPFVWILGITAAAILSDWVDGRLARWSDTVSDWGKVIDPIADKMAGGLIVGALVLHHRLPAWLIGLVVIRDILIILGGTMLTRRTGRVVISTWLGKMAAAALALTVLGALLEADPTIMTWSIRLTTALLVLSFLRYLVRFLRLLPRRRSDRSPDDDGHESSQSSPAIAEPKQEPENSVASNDAS